jgi:hypothetical protein
MLKVDFPMDEILRGLDDAQGKALRFATEFLQDMNQHVVENTPYLTGNLRGSWYAGLNAEPDAGNGPPDAGAGAVARLNLSLASLQLGDVYYAVNGANYAAYVEYGTSRMWPRAFVQMTVNMAGIYAEETAARIAAED